jgi:hypothetical protein
MPQLSPITNTELALLQWMLREVEGVAWYNSNALAGASQKHKHLQLLPADILWYLRDEDAEYVSVCCCMCYFVLTVCCAQPSLLDELILPHVEAVRWKALDFQSFRLV